MKSFAGAYSMKLNRRLFGLLGSGRFEFERKVNGLNRFLPITLFCFFLGFILGNLFGTFFVWSQTDFSLGWVYYSFSTWFHRNYKLR